MKKIFVTLAGTILACQAGSAFAGDTDRTWIVRAGITQLTLSDKLDLTVGGATVPGAALNTKTHYTPSIQISRFLTDHWAFSATVGIPPHIKLNGGGTVAAYGKLGETTYGPTAFTMQYHPLREGTVRPYVGLGASYMIIFSTKDAALQNVKMTNDLAPAIELGSDFMFDERHGMFLEVKKAWLSSKATGTLGGYPVVGKASVAPLVVSAGTNFRF
ncbi:OmpW/AlkL family protein [Asticcacaulis benevestitus]|uniref:OmpW family protein n=1 Tax=Asticcacaulis benevestitus DSM 16100 = ATCC BAA-896 TaxID=1121022 RepID=V4PRK1_9CAUL|nr:OmpW family outer membrane protein [Asticcacaulis benevestitus]ESQ88125.1 hypothetical protein ABENE_16480 [Asticcacaulis benevestitus DSM 16100 = ATCC BAA-896]